MIWSFSFQFMPDEKKIESSEEKARPGYRPLYSVVLTNKRAIFRFDSLGSSLSQSFFYHEIEEIAPHKRLMINYLHVKSKGKTHLVNAPDPVYWAERIMSMKESAGFTNEKISGTKEDKKAKLIAMLSELKEHSVLTEKEYEEKMKQIESTRP